jgi:hypothetical protein
MSNDEKKIHSPTMYALLVATHYVLSEGDRYKANGKASTANDFYNVLPLLAEAKKHLATLEERLADHPDFQPIPSGVYYSHQHHNFRDFISGKGMGESFYESWKERKNEFPQGAVSAAGDSDQKLSGLASDSNTEHDNGVLYLFKRDHETAGQEVSDHPDILESSPD